MVCRAISSSFFSFVLLSHLIPVPFSDACLFRFFRVERKLRGPFKSPNFENSFRSGKVVPMVSLFVALFTSPFSSGINTESICGLGEQEGNSGNEIPTGSVFGVWKAISCQGENIFPVFLHCQCAFFAGKSGVLIKAVGTTDASYSSAASNPGTRTKTG